MQGNLPFSNSLAASGLLLLILSAGCTQPGPPNTPQQALSTFQLEDGFRIELFAAEPLIADPVAMDFDEAGRLFVVEMPGYPLDTRPSGRIKLLEDTDGDGYPDRSTLFAEELTFPTGVMAWKKGILVTAAPDLLYLEDSDGDGRADVRRALLTGFAFSNPQHTVSDPLYGLDNWIYLAHEPATNAVVFTEEFGDRGGDIRFEGHPDLPGLPNSGRNIRFRPDTLELEALAGSSQFGHTFDAWGRHFTVSNSNHVRHEVIGGRYLERNPYLFLGRAMENMSDHGAAGRVFPITHRPRFEMLSGIGQFTSACGLVCYLGGAFPVAFDQVSFVAEPVHNLVHRDVWRPSGSTFVAERAFPDAEFLASTDSWFRPIFLQVGPDGALYVVDFYREAIEHPEWMAREAYESEDLYRGKEQGRIYRVIPDAPPLISPPANINLTTASLQELVSNLESPNIWRRRTAQRLLMDRQDNEAVPFLVRLFRETAFAPARVHALWSLEGLGQLEIVLLQLALEDAEPGVRENAILLAEGRLSENPRLVEKLLEMAEESDPRVRFQLLCTLGNLKSRTAQEVRDRLLFENIEDPWMQAAGLSSGPEESVRLFQTAVGRALRDERDRFADFLRLVCSSIGARLQPREIQSVLGTIRRHDSHSLSWPAAGLEGLASGLARGDPGAVQEIPIARTSLLALLDSSSERLRKAALQVLKVVGLSRTRSVAAAIRRAERTARDEAVGPGRRAEAIQLLSLSDPAQHEVLLKNIVGSNQPDEVRAAALTALGRIKGRAMGVFLLDQWQELTPTLRSAAAEALYTDPERAELLVDALARGQVHAATLTFRQTRRLIMHRDERLRERARALLERTPQEVEQTLTRYEAALDVEGSVIRGDQVFQRECLTCHSLDGEGGDFGPDLATIRNRPSGVLLTDILTPSKSIAQGYELYILRLHSGAILEGVITDRTSAALRLVHEDGEEEIVPHSEIAGMSASQLSAMPEGLEDKIDVAEMADLLAFLKLGR